MFKSDRKLLTNKTQAWKVIHCNVFHGRRWLKFYEIDHKPMSVRFKWLWKHGQIEMTCYPSVAQYIVSWFSYFISRNQIGKRDRMSIRERGNIKEREDHWWVEAQWRYPGQVHDRESMLECSRRQNFHHLKVGDSHLLKGGSNISKPFHVQWWNMKGISCTVFRTFKIHI